ncbi:MAG: alcohol dehydrogenase [Paraburkholderia sp.]|nr:alcohol dehydrogenase [Paraburkholderia sp.]
MVGQAADANATLAALRSLRRDGRLVLMGSMQVDLPIPYGEMLLNNWASIGHFMYTRADYLALVSLATFGQIPLEARPAASIAASSWANGQDFRVLKMDS